jgi:hypothetical protein
MPDHYHHVSEVQGAAGERHSHDVRDVSGAADEGHSHHAHELRDVPSDNELTQLSGRVSDLERMVRDLMDLIAGRNL